MPVRKPVELARQALRDKTLSPKTVAFKIVVQCRRAVQLATAEAITSGRREGVDTPGLELYLADIWEWFNCVVEKDFSRHDFFVQVLLAVRATYNEDTEWTIHGKPFDWANPGPFWGVTDGEIMECSPEDPCDDEGEWIRPYDAKLGKSILAGDPPPDTPEGRGWARSRARFLNYNVFCARLWALGIGDNSYWAMVMVNVYLEPLSLPEDEWRTNSRHSTHPRELKMEAAMAWLRIAGARMLACRKTWDRNDERKGMAIRVSFGTWKGVSGYHPDRWAYWKDILRALVEGEKGEWRPNVMEAAKSTLEAMEKVAVEARGLQS